MSNTEFEKSRRDFLSWIGALSAIWAFAPEKLLADSLSSGPIRGFAIGDGFFEIGYTHRLSGPSVASRPGKVLLSSFDGKRVNEIPTPFLPHEILQNPKKPAELVAIEKWGGNAMVFNLAGRNVTKRSLALPEGRYFFGHGSYDPSGELLFVSVMDYRARTGRIAVFDSGGKTVRWIDSGGVFPHEVKFTPDGKSLLVMNMGANRQEREGNVFTGTEPASNLARIDLESGKIADSHKVGAHGRRYGHFHVVDSQTVICMGIGRKDGKAVSALAVLKGGKKVDINNDPLLAGANGEVLSARVLPGGKAAAITFSDFNRLVILNLQELRVTKVLPVHNPRALIALPGTGAFLVSQSDRNGALPFKEFSYLDGEIVAPQSVPAWKANGAHFSEIVWPG